VRVTDPTNQRNMEIAKMLNKTTIALAASLIISTASGIMAADSGENHQDKRSDTFGVNPAEQRNDPAVQFIQPISPNREIRTDGRGAGESLREEKRDERREQKDERR
jgi:hypothetical protein